MKRNWFLAALAFFLSLTAVILLSSNPLASAPGKFASSPSLRSLIGNRPFHIATAVKEKPLLYDPMYGQVLAREFNTIMPENEFKFENVHPERDKYDFSTTDRLITFARTNGMHVRGHTLVWFHALPRWLLEGNFSRDELIAILEDHVKTVVRHYRGQVYAWDVVNEVLNADGSYRDTLWLRAIGPDYIDMAFRWAHEADPKALLFLNDYGEGLNAKSDNLYSLLHDLVSRSVPINGIGFQMHVGFLSSDNPQEVAANIKRIGDLGLEVAFTETDIPIAKLPGKTKAEKLAAQAKLYGELLQVCLDAPNCHTFGMWGFTDRYSWIKKFQGQDNAPLIFDAQYRPKPAHQAMVEVLQKWRRGD
ncbi:MAG: endo-1,4-beta-xylanase [Oscillatoriaceae cyanobacterium]